MTPCQYNLSLKFENWKKLKNSASEFCWWGELLWDTQGKSNPQSQGKLRWQWKELHLLEQCVFPRCTDFFHKDATCVYKDTCRLESSLLPTSIFPVRIRTKAKGIMKVVLGGTMQLSCGLMKHATIPTCQPRCKHWCDSGKTIYGAH